jgi:SAM-dependent methyltransferase
MKKDRIIMPICRICDAAEEDQAIRADFVFGGNEEHNFWHCQQCDAVYLYPAPSAEEEAIFYKREFEEFMSTRSNGERDWSGAEAHIKTNQDQVFRRWKFLEGHLSPQKSLLEIGCSSGFMLNAFRDHGLQCTGVEPSGEFVQFLEQNGYSAFNSLDELQQQKPQARFDLIVHFFVFEHIRDPFEFLKQSFDLLNPQGKIIAEIPCVKDPLTSLYEIPAFERFYWSIAHHYYYSPRSLSFILDKLNFNYQILPEQRYDLSNHMHWMMKGKPGGQGKYSPVFSRNLNEQYKNDLKEHWQCDTMFLIIEKN